MLECVIGTGGHGVVWRAVDRVAGGAVALKLLTQEATFDLGRVRREIATLRLLRLPGVVRLLDEGYHVDRAFIVMELVDGTPFPAAGAPCAWEALAPQTFSLLAALEGIHGAGVVHRDLKPENVLVDPSGRVTLLDFGIARLVASRNDRLTGEGSWLGTPEYLAPEQLLGDPVGPATDLYAVGLMLYEALAGRRPHAGEPLAKVIRARVLRGPPPLRDVAPTVPAAVASLVDRLLAPSIADRPQSAREVLAGLGLPRGDAASDLPWLGSRQPIERAVEALLAGRAWRVQSFPGGGSTRLAREVEAELTGAGRPTIAATAAQAPYASIEPLFHELAAMADADLATADRHAAAWLEALHARGGVLLVDDVGAIDSATRRLVDHAAARAVLSISSARDFGRADDRLEPLPAETLEQLFLGHDRLLHLREDAAAALHARTHGHPREIAKDLAGWTRLGIAQREGSRFRVDREAIDAVRGGLIARPALHAAERLPAHLVDTAALMELAYTHARPELIATQLGVPSWRVEADMRELVELGQARTKPDGSCALVAHVDVERLWPAEKVRAVRTSLLAALPPGTDGRLLLLLGDPSSTAEAVTDEVCVLARRLFDAGQTGVACTTLEEAVRYVRIHDEASAPAPIAQLERLFSIWVEIACSEATPRVLDRVVYEIARAPSPSRTVSRLAGLARGALELSSDPVRATATLEALGPFEDVALETCRATLRMIASRSMTLDDERRVLADVTTWVEAVDQPALRARLFGWQGRVRYREGRYAEAAELQLKAAEGLPRVFDRLVAQLMGASALLEAFEPEGVLAITGAVRAELQARRYPLLSARCEWLERAASYRLGRDMAPDLELVSAVEAFGAATMAPLVCLTEAAIAWRSRMPELTRDLAARAREGWERMGALPDAVLLMACLSVVAGDLAQEPTALQRRATSASPDFSLQSLGLLAMAGFITADGVEAARRALARIPRERWQRRIDVLSVDEARAALGIAAPPS